MTALLIGAFIVRKCRYNWFSIFMKKPLLATRYKKMQIRLKQSLVRGEKYLHV